MTITSIAAYQDNLTGLIVAVRADAGQPDLPFLIGQICPRPINLTMFQHKHALAYLDLRQAERI